MNAESKRARILHLHSTFDAGGKELRCVRLINAFGPQYQHTIVSSEQNALSAARNISKAISVSYPRNFPSLQGWPGPGRLGRIARAMRDFDLILTYNWGAMDAVMAHTLFSLPYRLPPLIHHEDGFNQDEAERLKSSRNWYRRIALGRCAALIVPSERLEQIALKDWMQPAQRVHRIANGLPISAYAGKTKADSLPGLIKRKGEYWIGTLAGLRPVKNLPRLVRAFAAADLPEEWQLVIVGEGPEEPAIRDEALRLGMAHRVHLPGFAGDPAKVAGLFDLFALSSDSEQFPLSVVEAMAAGLAVVAPAVGDVARIVAEPNGPFITPPGDEGMLAQSLARLAGDAGLRAGLGTANREKARAQFDEAAMIARYRALYEQALALKEP
jgi:glycosyltransferase involved in cell wall biosynthesis